MALLIGAACSAPFDVPIVWEGENLRVGTDADMDAWCQGTLPRMDAYTGALKDVMEVDDDLVVDFYVLRDPLDSYPIECARDDVGCAVDGVVYSRTIPHDHEVVHAVRDAAEGSPLAIEEGAASYWGGLQGEGDGSGSGADVRLADALAAGEEGRMTLADYERAAHFTSYLVHEWGREANAMLLRETSTNTTRAGIEEAFERTFGESFATTTAAYEKTWPWCSREAVRSSFFDCAGPAIRLCEGPVDDYPLVDLAFDVSWWIDHAFELDVSCADDRAVGPSRGTIWRDVVVDVPVGGVHTLGGLIGDGRDDDGDSTITLKRCDTECALAEPIEVPITASGALVTDVELQPGRYVIRVELREEIAGRIAIGWGCPST